MEQALSFTYLLFLP